MIIDCHGHDTTVPDASIAELERCVTELGSVGCDLNPDVSGGNWDGLPLTDRYWYPFNEKSRMVDHGLTVPLSLMFGAPESWPVRMIPLAVGVVQFPPPTGNRCYEQGKALRRAVETFPTVLRADE